jgi:pentatricopeptide repeat protein
MKSTKSLAIPLDAPLVRGRHMVIFILVESCENARECCEDNEASTTMYLWSDMRSDGCEIDISLNSK